MPQEESGGGMGRLLHTRRWLLVAPTLLLLWIIGQIDKTNISLVIADRAFLEELNAAGRNVELGGLMSSFFTGYALATFGWGFLVHRYGPRNCAMAGAGCWGVLLLWSSRANSIEELLWLRFLLGIAEGNLWPVSNVLTNRWFPAREHSRVQAFWLSGSTVGTAIGVPVVTVLMLASGWRGMLVVLASLSLVPLLFLVRVRNHPAEEKRLSRQERGEIERARKASGRSEPMGLLAALKSRPFWLVTVCQFLATAAIYTLIQWIPSFLTASHRLSFEGMGWLITIGYVTATALTLGVAYGADRTMKRPWTALWVSLCFALLILPGALWLPAMGSALFLATSVGAASSCGALNGAIIQGLVRPEAIARGTSVYVGIGNLGAVVGPLVFGLSLNVLGGQYWGGFVFLALSMGVCAACYLFLHRISRRVTQAADALSAITPSTPVNTSRCVSTSISRRVRGKTPQFSPLPFSVEG
ncbi:MAG: MFS transporter [Acidobacteria bacterium]|nr:MFS transporter [Acidobacteriota bacterium]